MPLPKPRSDEGQDAFINRCMSWMADNNEGDSQDQRLAMCYSQWRNKMNESFTKRIVLKDLKFTEEAGTFKAVFATMNVVDSDGDLTLPGAFGKQNVILSQYNHGSWDSGVKALPIGVGVISEDGDNAIIEGEFNMESVDAVQTYKTLKYLYEKSRTQEWSYALPEIDYEMQEIDGRSIRLLKRIKVNEVSPVLMGAGVDTRLLSIKNNSPKAIHTESMSLIDHLEVVVADVERVVERIKSVGELREAKDRLLAEATMKKVALVKASLLKFITELGEVQEVHQAVYKEFLRFQKILLQRGDKHGFKEAS